MTGVPAMRTICKTCHTEVEMLESDVFLSQKTISPCFVEI